MGPPFPEVEAINRQNCIIDPLASARLAVANPFPDVSLSTAGKDAQNRSLGNRSRFRHVAVEVP